MGRANKYLMSINHYSGAKEQFEVAAANKADAIEKAKVYVLNNPHFWGGNYPFDSIKCIKKIRR